MALRTDGREDEAMWSDRMEGINFREAEAMEDGPAEAAVPTLSPCRAAVSDDSILLSI